MTNATLLTGAADIVGDQLGLDPLTITAKRKGSPPVAFARQVVAYVLHTEAQLDKQQVGRLLQRHRSTIGHAIEMIEDRREDGPLSDMLDAVAARFRAVLPPRAAAPVLGVRLSDPLARSLTAALTEAGLYGSGDSVTLDRDDDRLTVHVMLKALGILAQTQEIERASLTRKVLVELANSEGWALRFADKLWCERGTKGWRVVAKFRRQSAPTPPAPG